MPRHFVIKIVFLACIVAVLLPAPVWRSVWASAQTAKLLTGTVVVLIVIGVVLLIRSARRSETTL